MSAPELEEGSISDAGNAERNDVPVSETTSVSPVDIDVDVTDAVTDAVGLVTISDQALKPDISEVATEEIQAATLIMSGGEPVSLSAQSVESHLSEFLRRPEIQLLLAEPRLTAAMPEQLRLGLAKFTSSLGNGNEPPVGGVLDEPRLAHTSDPVKAGTSSEAMEVEGNEAVTDNGSAPSKGTNSSASDSDEWTRISRSKRTRSRRERLHRQRDRKAAAAKLQQTERMIQELQTTRRALVVKAKGKPEVLAPKKGTPAPKRKQSVGKRPHTEVTTGKSSLSAEVHFLGTGGYSVAGQRGIGKEVRSGTHALCCQPYLNTWFRIKAHLDVHHADCRYYCWVCGEKFTGNLNRRHLLTDHCQPIMDDVNADPSSRTKHRAYCSKAPGAVGGLWHQLPTTTPRSRLYSPYYMTHNFTDNQLKNMGVLKQPVPVHGTLTKSSDKGKSSKRLKAERRTESVSSTPSTSTRGSKAKKLKGEARDSIPVPLRQPRREGDTSRVKLGPPSELTIPKKASVDRPTYASAVRGPTGESRAEPKTARVRLDPDPSLAISVVGTPALHGHLSSYPYRVLHGEVFYTRSYWVDGSVKDRRPSSVGALTKSTLTKSAEPKH